MHKFSVLNVPLFLSFFILAVSAGCSSSKNNSGERSVTGQIQMVNNEPFTELAVRNEYEFYILDCSGAERKKISGNQGRTAKIYFSKVSTNNLNQKVIKVEKIELLPAGSQ